MTIWQEDNIVHIILMQESLAVVFRLVKERQIKTNNAHCLPCANFQHGGYEVEISLVW